MICTNRFTFAEINDHEMKFILTTKIFAIIISSLFIFSNTSFAQSSEHAEERLKADALAVAYLDCDLSLAKYNFSLNPDNEGVTIKVQALSKLESQMSVNMFTRYKDEDQKKKLEREVKSAKKKLNKCIKYQNILDAKEEEKQKAKLDQ